MTLMSFKELTSSQEAGKPSGWEHRCQKLEQLALPSPGSARQEAEAVLGGDTPGSRDDGELATNKTFTAAKKEARRVMARVPVDGRMVINWPILKMKVQRPSVDRSHRVRDSENLAQGDGRLCPGAWLGPQGKGGKEQGRQKHAFIQHLQRACQALGPWHPGPF